MITQKDMAAILQIAPGMYALYENGNRRMRLEMLIQLADILETSTDYLLGRTDEAAPYPKAKAAFKQTIKCGE